MWPHFQNHFNAILQYNKDLELVSVCDNDQAVLNKAVKELKVSGYRDLSDMLENVKLDLVVLCTPSGLHPKQAILAAKYGVNVVSEKPMATKYSDGLAMVEACDNANVRLFVVKQNRCNATLQLLKRAVDEDVLAKLKWCTLMCFGRVRKNTMMLEVAGVAHGSMMVVHL